MFPLKPPKDNISFRDELDCSRPGGEDLDLIVLRDPGPGGTDVIHNFNKVKSVLSLAGGQAGVLVGLFLREVPGPVAEGLRDLGVEGRQGGRQLWGGLRLPGQRRAGADARLRRDGGRVLSGSFSPGQVGVGQPTEGREGLDDMIGVEGEGAGWDWNTHWDSNDERSHVIGGHTKLQDGAVNTVDGSNGVERHEYLWSGLLNLDWSIGTIGGTVGGRLVSAGAAGRRRHQLLVNVEAEGEL